ncbi:hypothetical protein A2592_00190 [Candidatus Kaiserbacteria bacterium RIFOXYD1_FULL_42_15]|uniref:Polysaccharide biosynthesis protein C-terminal domain-containing protein n=1 Tax=Candidatus Kaiserbacteria bacterium RIFOXYD1_FULL_42_15 TaxID=1798532 RepID=A0A1F6FTT2_9BACT|nr:MAG: hypothetical protein A2592_00190 [Candidatus Kaiserbacteria bacterium RIFOXYD1_FULL_42_15]
MRQIVKKILSFSERYTKTDMTYLVKGGFWLMVSYIFQIGIGVITTIALANFLPKESLGTYQFILSIAAILSVFTLSGLGTAITRAVARGHEGVLRSGVRTKLKWSVGIVIASGATSLYYYLNDNSSLATAFLVVGTFAPFIESFKLYINYLHGKEAFRDNLLLGAWRKPLPLIAILVALYFTDNVIILIFVYFSSNAISLIAVYYSVLRKYNPPKQSDAETLQLSKHLSIFSLVTITATHIDKILIWHFLGATAVAGYTIAQLGTKYSGGFINTVSVLVLPKVSRRDLYTLQQTLPRKVRLFTALMILGAGVYILAVPFIFPLLFPQYPESVAFTQVLAIGLIFIPLSAYSKVLTAHKQLRAQYILSISNALIKIILLYTLLPLYGVWGAIYAILATELVSSITVRYFFAIAKSPSRGSSEEPLESPDRDV